MLNEKVDIEIRGRKLRVEMEGFTPIEINSLAQLVSDRMAQVEAHTKTPDTQKLAILTAMEFAGELWKLKSKHENERLAEERKLEEMIVSLQNAVQK